MRHLVVAACGTAIALTATSFAFAASFSGPPFLISEGEAFKPFSGPVYETASGDLAAVLAHHETHDLSLADAIYLKLFNADGTLKRAKKLVFRGAPTSDGPANVSIAGATPLADGRLMVGYVEKREELSGVFARIVTDGETVGPELVIHTEPADADPVEHPHRLNGFLLPLTFGGVAIWANANKSYDEFVGAQRVSASGEISAASTDLARAQNYVTGVSGYLDGFIVRYSNPKQNNVSNQSAQIFGSDGEKIGPEIRLEHDVKHVGAEDVRTLGLADGSIVVLRKTRVKRSYAFSAEVFDGSWRLKKAETVIATTTIDAPFGAAAVPGGDFLFGVTKPNSDGLSGVLEFQRLNQLLKLKGAPIRMGGTNSPFIQQMLARKNGDVLMTYISYSPGRKGKFSGRFIKT